MRKLILFYLLSSFCILSAHSNAIWHWHRRISFTHEDLEILSRSGFTDIFIHCGAFTLFRGNPDFGGTEFDSNLDKIVPILNNFNLHVVFTFDSWGKTNNFYSDHILKKKKESFDFIIRIIENQIEQFKARNIEIKGIQLDLEGYNIDLNVYNEMISEVKKRFPAYKISITPMVSWLKSKEFKNILSNIDFYVPMVYDLHRGKTIKEDTRITDINWIRGVVETCESLGKPYFFGLPSYYYRILFNEKMQRLNSWMFINFDELSANKAFELVESRKNYVRGDRSIYNGDNIYVYKVVEPVYFKFYYLPAGSHLLYNVITPQGLRSYVETVKRASTKNLLGIAVFRYTRPAEPYLIKTMHFPYIFSDQILYVDSNIDFHFGGESFWVNLKNTGNSESFVEQNAVQVLIRLEGGSINTVVKNNFDDFDMTMDFENNISFLTLTNKFFALDREISSGPIDFTINDTENFSIKYQVFIKAPDGNFHGPEDLKWQEVWQK